jgi:hypothetical protein
MELWNRQIKDSPAPVDNLGNSVNWSLKLDSD